MAALLITTIEGMLIGLGFGLGLDRLFNWSNPNFLFVAMFMVAGAILGMLGGYFFVGSVHEQPWMVLVGQAAAAVVAV
ncbi:MAG: hypothetical protein NTZ05_05120, partial [Chloroflexi bacterium]|nr:hypothetical protein [Chloroflexota bacterium]